MTKLLILSDSHNSASAVERILHAESDATAVVFLGDGLRDLEDALTLHPKMKVYAVAGNCDFGALEPLDGLAAFDQVVVFYTHGHMYGVKYDLDTLADAAAARGAEVALFGHTHKPTALQKNGVFLFKPGLLRPLLHRPQHLRRDAVGQGQDHQLCTQRGTAAMSINEVRYLPECGSTNAYMKDAF